MEGNLTRQEVQFQKTMGVFAALYLVFAALVALIPEHLLMFYNFVSNFFGMLKSPVVLDITSNLAHNPLVAERSYVGMSAALMIVLFVICLGCFVNPRKYMDLALIVMLSEALGSLFGLGYFFWSARYLANLILPICGLPTFFVILVFWLRAKYAGKAKGEAAKSA